MDFDEIGLLRADIDQLRNGISGLRQNVGILETRMGSIEAWRVHYLAQEDQVIGKIISKAEELVAGLSDMRVELSRIRGERDVERRMTMMIIGVLSAVCGGLTTSLFHG